jgi:low affinity Fe/Cu permease
MPDTATRPEHHAAPPSQAAAAATARAAVRANSLAAARAAERAEEIRRAPQLHVPKLVVSRHVRGNSLLDKIAAAVNRVCGSMWVFLFITIGIVAWLFMGNIVGFDKTPWPLLLTILNLPQLSIMISLQVSANRAQAASDKRAIADHETLIALHEMAKQQLTILHGQDKVLAMLNQFASKDMPGKQAEILAAAHTILARVSDTPAAG